MNEQHTTQLSVKQAMIFSIMQTVLSTSTELTIWQAYEQAKRVAEEILKDE